MSDHKNRVKPAVSFPTPEQVPAELRSLPRWIGFRLRWDEEKNQWTKPPCSAVTGEERGWPNAGITFEEAVSGAQRLGLDGVGFVFKESDGYVGIDFDGCVTDNVIAPDVLAWTKWFPSSYIERSISGTGIHIITKGQIAKAVAATPLPGNPGVTVEVYGDARYFTWSGHIIDSLAAKLEDNQPSLDKLCQALGEKPGASSAQDDSPKTLSQLKAIYEKHLEDFRKMTRSEDNQNAQLNTCAWFAARALPTGALGKTAQELQDELRTIAKSTPYCPGLETTLRSGWRNGEAQGPFKVIPGILATPTHVREMIKQSEQVLQKIGLKYFERNGELVNTCFGRDIPKSKEIERAEDSVVIVEASHQSIICDLDSNTRYIGIHNTKNGPKENIIHVPKILPSHIHNRVHTEPRDVPFPTLDMVTATPVLLPSGDVSKSIFAEGVLYIPHDRRRFPEIPSAPTQDDARKALRKFEVVFGQFPFVDPGEEKPWNETASYSVVLAGILSLVARPHLGLSSIPLISSRASSPRSGKTKIIEAITVAALGHKPTAVNFTDEEEFAKHLQPLMRAGDRSILIDNVERVLQGSKLCILITGGVLRDRILGESRDVVMKNYAVMFATGNNIVIGGDLTSRTLRIDIDPRLERPETRRFDFDPVARATELQPQLVTAALTALRAYYIAGAPWTLTRAPWGGFKEWDELVSGCLTWLGYADPYATSNRVIDADPIRGNNVEILESWFSRYGSKEVSLAEIKQDQGEVYEALLSSGSWDGHHAQWILRRLEGRIVNGYRLVRLEGRSRFRVLKVGGDQLSLEPFRFRNPAKPF